jgi:hypothetical protein
MFPRGTASRDDCDDISLRERLSVLFIGVQLVLRRWLRRFLEPGAVLVSVAVVVAGVTGILRTVDWPSNGGWKGHSPLNIVYAISAVIALVGAFLVGAWLRLDTQKGNEPRRTRGPLQDALGDGVAAYVDPVRQARRPCMGCTRVQGRPIS